MRVDCNPIPTTLLTIELASSVGSIKVLMKVSRPLVVDKSCPEEM
jgi:hypothetical protein